MPISGKPMAKRSLANAVYKLALAGEQVGLSLEEMIQILNAGVTVEALIDLIESRLRTIESLTTSSLRIM